MKAFRYSRWDGSQADFELDAKEALDALSDLMMEGLSAQEALEWMQRYGFPLAGVDMAVMGTEEMVSQLRDQLEELRQRYDLGDSMDDIRKRLEKILDKEQSALQSRHGHESLRLNDFLQRRHEGADSVFDRIDRFEDHVWEDPEAEEEFRELQAKQSEIQGLEQFLEQQGHRFRGPLQAGYETAQEVREEVEAIQQMMEDLQSGNFESISIDQLRELLGEPGAQSLMLLQKLESELEGAGLMRDGELTPRAIRKIGASALSDVYSSLRKSLAGEHETPGYGVGIPRPDETRLWQFGDTLDLDIVKTVMNAVTRSSGGGQSKSGGVSLEVDDFEIREKDYSTETTTILLLDMSWSMSWEDRFPAAKRVALAMDQLIRTQFPRDHFSIVGFSTQARELTIKELPEVSWDMNDPFTNLQEGLMVAERLIGQHRSANPQIIVITDGQPTAYYQGGNLRVEWPNGMGGISPHAVNETLKQVKRVTRMGVTINTFMLDDAPELVGFVEHMTKINKGRAFYTSPHQLGSFLMVDYLSQRRLRRR